MPFEGEQVRVFVQERLPQLLRSVQDWSAQPNHANPVIGNSGRHAEVFPLDRGWGLEGKTNLRFPQYFIRQAAKLPIHSHPILYGKESGIDRSGTRKNR